MHRLRPRDDLDFQRQMVHSSRRQAHEKWCAEHQARQRFDAEQNKVRADLIVNEARRLEREHLSHQLQYARELVRYTKRKGAQSRSGRNVGSGDTTPPPSGGLSARHNVNTSHHIDGAKSSPSHESDCASPGSPKRTCGCLRAPLCRQITPKYRALALLKQTFEHDKVEEAWETLRETYASDHDMLDDLIYRYGPEPEDVSPNTRLRCVEEKVDECDDKWRRVGEAAMDEMRYRDAYPNVIRNLSIMRIFLEGSQAQHYGCDTGERGRRDAFHQGVLDELAQENALFLTPARARGL